MEGPMNITAPAQTPTLQTALTELLTRSVRIAVKNDQAEPRPGQLALTLDIWQALSQKAGMSGIAPTGTGKSLSHMSCAALAAQALHERTVISTDSLALQAQFIEKDLPVIAEALKEMTGFELHYAVLKGVNNYVDPVSAMVLAQSLTGLEKEKHFPTLIQALAGDLSPDFKADGWGEFSSKDTLAALAAWALGVYLDDREPGDRDSCPVEHTSDDWQLVNATSDTKASEEDSGYPHKGDLAKEVAGESDIVVTNHTLLGMQAARGIPVVLGSSRLGRFHNIIVDEAHTLPAQVRSRGANEVSERTIRAAARAVEKVIDGKWISEDADRVIHDLNKVLKREVADLKKSEDALRIPANETGPLDEVSDQLLELVAVYTSDVQRASKASSDLGFRQKCRSALGALERLGSAVEEAITPNNRTARWVSKGEDKHPPKFESSPVDVSGLIYNRLWNTDPMDDTEEKPEEPIVRDPDFDEEEEPAKLVPMGVACVSATLPSGFNMQVALGGAPGEYQSPFGEAYAHSAAFIPVCNDERDINMLASKYSTPGRPAFDTYSHDDWCVPHILDLVEANGGSALVLAAKAASGKKYAAALRKAFPDMDVYSQWDGGQVTRIVHKWRENHGSVLVGTKSLFTGVDAPGETNSLVIIDRPPRAAKNVIDEARVELLMSQGFDRWTADRLVYVADAGMLLEQGIGRLVRHTSDRGMVAVLDPRLLTQPDTVFTYQFQTQQMFVRPLVQFGQRFKSRREAMEWLKARQGSAAR